MWTENITFVIQRVRPYRQFIDPETRPSSGSNFPNELNDQFTIFKPREGIALILNYILPLTGYRLTGFPGSHHCIHEGSVPL